MAAGMVVNIVCQWASIRPGISVLPVPSIVVPRRCVEPAGVTEVMSPSEIAEEITKRLTPFYNKDAIYVSVEVTEFATEYKTLDRKPVVLAK